MLQNKWVLGVFTFLLVAMLFAGYLAVAAEIGSKDDPLVAVSYIQNELMPVLNDKIDAAVQIKNKEYSDQLNQQYQTLLGEFQRKAAELMTGSGSINDEAFVNAVAEQIIAKQGSSGGVSDGMKKVEVASGKTVTLDIGAEVLLRVGAATCVADSATGLIDMTTGSTLAGGAALEKSHLYLSTIEGRGFKCTANCTVFIRGGYTVK